MSAYVQDRGGPRPPGGARLDPPGRSDATQATLVYELTDEIALGGAGATTPDGQAVTS